MFAKIENNSVVEYPLGEYDIKGRFPNTSFASNFAECLPEGYVPVLPASAPSATELTNVTEGTPIFQDNQWQQSWIVTNKYTPEELIAYNEQKLKTNKEKMWGIVKNTRDRILSGGVKVNINGADKWFHTDLYSRTQWLGMMLLGINLPADIQWKTMDGSFVTLDTTIVTQVFSAIQAKEIQTFAFAEQLKVQIDQATDPTMVVINNGWPETYTP